MAFPRNRATLQDMSTLDCEVCEGQYILQPLVDLATHNHDEMHTCQPCFDIAVAQSLRQNGSKGIRCTECTALISPDDVARACSPEVLAKVRAAQHIEMLKRTPGYYQCFACNHHDIVQGTRITCKKCNRIQCSKCMVDWHDGLTCKEKQAQIKHILRQTKMEDKTALKQISKSCPKCGSRIDKNDGCDHMTCKCLTFLISLNDS